MTRYTEAKSKFVKEQIKKTKWEDSSYIDDLLQIERVVSGEHLGWMTGYLDKILEGKYPKEYKAIYLELNPKIWKELKKEEKKEKEKERREDERLRKEEEEEEKQDKKDWKKMGGK